MTDTGTRRTTEEASKLSGFWLRMISFGLASLSSGLILIFPRLLASSPADINHGLLLLYLTAIAAGFVHGVGFVPCCRWLCVLIGPIVSWPVMMMGLGFMLTAPELVATGGLGSK